MGKDPRSLAGGNVLCCAPLTLTSPHPRSMVGSFVKDLLSPLIPSVHVQVANTGGLSWLHFLGFGSSFAGIGKPRFVYL